MTRQFTLTRLLVLSLAGTFALANAVQAQEASVYRWVDADGVPHYSDQPAADSSAQEMTIRYRKTDKGAVQARQKAKAESDEAADVRESQVADDEAANEADREKVLAEREATCKQAKERVAKYNNALRLYKPGQNGERVYLTDEELDVERADANRAVEEWCSNE